MAISLSFKTPYLLLWSGLTIGMQALADTGPEYLEFEPEQSPISAALLQYKLPFIEQRHNYLQLRSYFLDRDIDDTVQLQDWAGGGWFKVVSDYWDGRIQLGGTAFTSQKIYADDDKGDTGLLEPGHSSFSGLSEFYGSLALDSAAIKLGRFELNLPYMNKSDIRMIPQSFEAAKITVNLSPEWTLVGGVATKIKPRNDSEFISLYEDAGLDKDKNVSGIGSIYQSGEGDSTGLYYFRAPDYYENNYIEISRRFLDNSNSYVQLGAQYTHQRAIGKKLGGEFDVDHFGAKATWKSNIFSVSTAYTYYSDTEVLRRPWGSIPGYTSVMVKDFARPGEKAWLVGATWDLKALGVPDIEANIKYIDGNTPDYGSTASPDQQETDITIQYKPAAGLLKGLSVRLRKAWINQENSSRGNDAFDSEDIRLIVNYQIEL